MLRAITFDYWDTLYAGAALPERMTLRRTALKSLLARYGQVLEEERLAELYRASGVEADRWWRDEHRGYTAADRIRWILQRLGIEPPADCPDLATACTAVDDALITLPPELLPGARRGIHALGARFRLGIISDTGFASGAAQNRILERDDLRAAFRVTVYSADLGHAKPRPEPFAQASAALGVEPAAIIHVGDNERTDVRGALDAGLRAVRVDIVRSGGKSAAEYVAHSFDDLVEYLESAA